MGDSNFGDFSFRQKREVIIIVEETFKILNCQSTTITTVESRETQKYGNEKWFELVGVQALRIDAEFQLSC